MDFWNKLTFIKYIISHILQFVFEFFVFSLKSTSRLCTQINACACSLSLRNSKRKFLRMRNEEAINPILKVAQYFSCKLWVSSTKRYYSAHQYHILKTKNIYLVNVTFFRHNFEWIIFEVLFFYPKLRIRYQTLIIC